MYSMKNSQYTMISIRLCSARARCDDTARAASAACAPASPGLAKMPPSQRALQRLRLHPRGRTFWEFCDQAGDKVIENIILSCDDPGDMFAIIVSTKQFAMRACSVSLVSDFRGGSQDAVRREEIV